MLKRASQKLTRRRPSLLVAQTWPGTEPNLPVAGSVLGRGWTKWAGTVRLVRNGGSSRWKDAPGAGAPVLSILVSWIRAHGGRGRVAAVERERRRPPERRRSILRRMGGGLAWW
jgi:hypothetical protein